MTQERSPGNVNVTLEGKPRHPDGTFPCPTCNLPLELRTSKQHKPYCVCNSCGVQLFFRGKPAIARLQRLSDTNICLQPLVIDAREPALIFARLARLRTQLGELRDKRPLIFSDSALEHAIVAVERDIARVAAFLDALAHRDLQSAGTGERL